MGRHAVKKRACVNAGEKREGHHCCHARGTTGQNDSRSTASPSATAKRFDGTQNGGNGTFATLRTVRSQDVQGGIAVVSTGPGAPPTSSPSLPSQPEKLPLVAPLKEPEQAPTPVTVTTSVTKAASSRPVPQACVDQPTGEGMDTTQEPASTAPGKQPHDQTSSSEPRQDDGGGN
ncbi:hypothetical protein MRX96_015976 [Rhipicephalus microplus]